MDRFGGRSSAADRWRPPRIVAAASVSLLPAAILDRELEQERIEAAGDAAIPRLTRDLPNVSPAPVGPGRGDSFTIAGYGMTNERGGGV